MSNRIKSGEIQIGNNYVLPIEQSRVTVQEVKVQKILEETDSKVKQIIDGAENKSQIIVNTANTEAERIIEESRKKAQNDYDSVKSQAYEEGFKQGQQEGFEKFLDDAKKAIESLETLASSSFDTKKNIIDSATLDIVELVSAIADKVCHIKFDEEVLHKITLDAIKELNEKESITIIVNPKLVEEVNKITPLLKDEIPKLQSIKITEDNSVSPDGVIVETLRTRLDSRISTRIDEIARNMLMGADNELQTDTNEELQINTKKLQTNTQDNAPADSAAEVLAEADDDLQTDTETEVPAETEIDVETEVQINNDLQNEVSDEVQTEAENEVQTKVDEELLTEANDELQTGTENELE